jgi:AcrR family transcriptional regulator
MISSSDRERMNDAAPSSDLAVSLVAAALILIERNGLAGLSLRAVARAAGVSAMAPYHHFADRRALVAAVAVVGFERLYGAKLAATAGIADPRAALVAGSRAYVRFVIENPALYQLMKGPEIADRAAHPALVEAASRPAASLARLLADAGATPEAAEALWALVHGFGLLAIDGYLRGSPETLVDRAGDAARTLLRGLG